MFFWKFLKIPPDPPKLPITSTRCQWDMGFIYVYDAENLDQQDSKINSFITTVLEAADYYIQCRSTKIFILP